MTAVAATLRGFNPKDPVPVNGRPIPKVKRFALQVAWSAVFAFLVAGPIIMTAYFFVTQVRYSGVVGGHQWVFYLKPGWDSLLDAQLGFNGWYLTRHLWRNLLDPIMGTVFVKSLMANWKKDPDDRCSVLYLIASPFIILFVATVLIAAVAGLAYWWVPWIGTNVPGTVLQVAAGILIGLFVHPIYAPAGRTIQGYFVDRQVGKSQADGRVVRHAPPGWFPPVVQELYWHKMDSGVRVAKPGRGMRLVAPPFALLFFAMDVFGLIIKFGIAPGHLHWFGV